MDEASLTSLPLTSCCMAQFLTGYRSLARGLGTPAIDCSSSNKLGYSSLSGYSQNTRNSHPRNIMHCACHVRTAVRAISFRSNGNCGYFQLYLRGSNFLHNCGCPSISEVLFLFSQTTISPILSFSFTFNRVDSFCSPMTRYQQLKLGHTDTILFQNTESKKWVVLSD